MKLTISSLRTIIPRLDSADNESPFLFIRMSKFETETERSYSFFSTVLNIFVKAVWYSISINLFGRE